MSTGSSRRLVECLDALADQRDAPTFEVIVAHDPRRLPAGIDDRPEVSLRPGGTSPPELAATGARVARGAVVLLTEDHCVPGSGWVGALHSAVAEPGVGAAGGPVAAPDDATPFDWAFHASDFAAHLPPVQAGPVPTLSVCNVAYTRRTLEALDEVWAQALHETRVHDVIRRRVGALLRVPSAPVVSRRRVRPGNALAERFAFGRLYGALRFAERSTAFRWARGLAAVVLPALLLFRTVRAGRRAGVATDFMARALPWILVLVTAWSAGEGVGTATGRPPAEARAAPERDGEP